MGLITSKGRKRPIIIEPTNHYDEAVEVETELGGGRVAGGVKTMTVHNEELKKVIEDGRREIKETQEKLNSSLTTPIVDSEAKVILYYYMH